MTPTPPDPLAALLNADYELSEVIALDAGFDHRGDPGPFFDRLAMRLRAAGVTLAARPSGDPDLEGDAGTCPTCGSRYCVGRLQWEDCARPSGDEALRAALERMSERIIERNKDGTVRRVTILHGGEEHAESFVGCAICQARAALAAPVSPSPDVERLARALQAWWSSDDGTMPGSDEWEHQGRWRGDAEAIAREYVKKETE